MKRKLLQRFSRLKQKEIAIIILLVFITVTQIRTLTLSGELLGFKVLRSAQQQRSAGLTPHKNEVKNSLVCKKLSAEFVSTIVGATLKQSTIMADSKNPFLSSSCIYKSEPQGKQRQVTSVTVSLQEKADKKSASQAINQFKERAISDVTKVDNLGDEAYFNKKLNQVSLTKDNKFITIFVYKNSDQPINVVKAASSIARKIF